MDQILRLEAFRRANPGVVVLSPRATGRNEWLASWDEEQGSTTVTRYDLGELLNVLEERFGVPG